MTALLASLLLAASPPLVQFETYTLPNGLTVILTPDQRLPTIGVNLWYHVGGANETPGRSGFAHLFEHLMFQGTKHRPGNEQEFDGLMEAAGGSDTTPGPARIGPTTTRPCPANRLELALWLEADRLRCSDGDRPEKLDAQRDVVRNERRQTQSRTRPTARRSSACRSCCIPKRAPLHHAVIGSHEDLQAATVDDVKGFFARWYVPANASLVIAGDFDPARRKALVEKYFGPIPRSPKPPRPRSRPSPSPGRSARRSPTTSSWRVSSSGSSPRPRGATRGSPTTWRRRSSPEGRPAASTARWSSTGSWSRRWTWRPTRPPSVAPPRSG